MNFISKYFVDTEEYPKEVAVDPIPWGCFWDYISTTFLDGFINYAVDPYTQNCGVKSAFLLARYTEWNEKVPAVDIQDPPNSFKWTTFEGTKKEVFEKLIEPGRVCHSKLDSVFQDDVLILAKLAEQRWMVFWYNRDCSDSKIGRFETATKDEEVIADFKFWALNPEFEYIKFEQAREIPVSYFKGWVSSGLRT